LATSFGRSRHDAAFASYLVEIRQFHSLSFFGRLKLPFIYRSGLEWRWLMPRLFGLKALFYIKQWFSQPAPVIKPSFVHYETDIGTQ
jgi:hypothetical protein